VRKRSVSNTNCGLTSCDRQLLQSGCISS